MEGKRWTVRDRYGYELYLTEERWEHIIDPENHPEMEAYEDELIETVRSGTRLQEPLNPQNTATTEPLLTSRQETLTSLRSSFAALEKHQMGDLCQTITLLLPIKK